MMKPIVEKEDLFDLIKAKALRSCLLPNLICKSSFKPELSEAQTFLSRAIVEKSDAAATYNRGVAHLGAKVRDFTQPGKQINGLSETDSILSSSQWDE